MKIINQPKRKREVYGPHQCRTCETTFLFEKGDKTISMVDGEGGIYAYCPFCNHHVRLNPLEYVPTTNKPEEPK